MNPPESLSDIQRRLAIGSLTLKALVSQYLDRIDHSRSLNIYVEVYEKEAIERANFLDAKYREDPDSIGRLFGLVISIKDILCLADHKVSAASGILDGFISQFTATALQRALDEDAIIIGRTNCDEFAMGSTNEHSVYGPTLNGLDPQRVPGGSSGGAAVSVQQKTCLLALGSDTGGSVRQPAAMCGLTGFKPTYGRISRNGLIAYASSFDQIGIIGHRSEDIAHLLVVIEGLDELDSTSSNHTPTSLTFDQHSYRIAYFPEVLSHKSLHPEIRKGMDTLLENLVKEGHQVEPYPFHHLDYLVPTYYVLTTAEASSNLSRYDGLRYGSQVDRAADIPTLINSNRTQGFGIEAKRRIMMGTFVLSVGYYDAYFTKAQKVRNLIIEEVNSILEAYDFILMPTLTDFAPKLKQTVNDPVSMYLADIFTVLANLCGLPAISIPTYSNVIGMPYGFQLIGEQFSEGQILRFAEYFEKMA